jgi:hypothetical protein
MYAPPRTLASSLVTVTSVFLLAAGLLVGVAMPWLLREADESECGAHEELCSHSDPTGFVVSGTLVVAAGAWGLVVAAGLRRQRTWARVGSLVTFGAYAVVALADIGLAVAAPDEPRWAATLPPTIGLGLVGVVLWATLADRLVDG